jgi:hypothetical protein
MVAGWQKIKITVKAGGSPDGIMPVHRIDHRYSNGSLFATGYGHAVAYNGLNSPGRRAFTGFNPAVRQLTESAKVKGNGVKGHGENIAILEEPAQIRPFEFK